MGRARLVLAALGGWLFVAIVVANVVGEIVRHVEQPDWACRLNVVFGLFFSPACEDATLGALYTIFVGVPRLLLMPFMLLVVEPQGAFGNPGLLLYAIVTALIVAQGFAYWYARRRWVAWALLGALAAVVASTIAFALVRS